MKKVVFLFSVPVIFFAACDKEQPKNTNNTTHINTIQTLPEPVLTNRSGEFESPYNTNNPMETYGLAVRETIYQANESKRKGKVTYKNIILEIGPTLLPEPTNPEATFNEYDVQILDELLDIFENQNDWTELRNAVIDKEQYILSNAELSEDSQNALLATSSVLKFYHYTFLTEGIIINGEDILLAQPDWNYIWHSCMREHVNGSESSLIWVFSGNVFSHGIDCAFSM